MMNQSISQVQQTGSGKTYTMGTNYNGEGGNNGIIPTVMEKIYKSVQAMKESIEFLIRVSFIEIFKEEVFDLLDPNSPALNKGEWENVAKLAAHARVPIQIRETANGGITLAGVTKVEVRAKEEMASYLSRGSLARATGITNMEWTLRVLNEQKGTGVDGMCFKERKAASVEIEIPADGVPIEWEVDIAVDFIAPKLAGRYICYRRMASPDCVKFVRLTSGPCTTSMLTGNSKSNTQKRASNGLLCLVSGGFLGYITKT